KLLDARASLLRVILGSLLGGVFSLAALLPKLPFGLNLISDLVFAALIVLVSLGFGGMRVFLRRVAVYFGLSFGFCGLMVFVYTTFHPKGMEIYNDTVYFNISPFLLIILTLACYYTTRLLKRLTKGVCGKSTCHIEISMDGTETSFLAVVDTGCTVKEPFSGDYVIIAEDSILRDLHLCNDKMRVIPFESLGGKGFIRGYRLSSLKIDGKESEQDVYLGVCENVLNGEIRALVPYELTESEVI
ncbi:MAG: sigma-E processing peptidase SpoIIGA, partial [Ruminococcus sp.]|nr:sigma-E processing peptidase SpoIIGA [Ruminococcus sp.]